MNTVSDWRLMGNSGCICGARGTAHQGRHHLQEHAHRHHQDRVRTHHRHGGLPPQDRRRHRQYQLLPVLRHARCWNFRQPFKSQQLPFSEPWIVLHALLLLPQQHGQTSDALNTHSYFK